MNIEDFKKVAYEIKKLGEEVFKNLGSGFTEVIFHNALGIELRRNKIEYLSEVNIEIFYKGESVGADRPDFIITKIKGFNKPIILELKVADKITDEHRIQLKSYCTSVPFNNNPVLNEFAGGILLTWPKNDIEDPTKVKIFAVDSSFKTLINEQKDEEEALKLQKEREKEEQRLQKEREKGEKNKLK